MSSTQGHTNINTVHTTIDISVLLGEINRIADDSYVKGFESGYDVGVKKGKADAIKDAELFREIFLYKLKQQSADMEERLMYKDICTMAWNEFLEQMQRGIENE